MNRTGGLRIATILVVFIFGFSTLAVGVQLSSSANAGSTHYQGTNQGVPGIQHESDPSGMQQSSNGTGDILPLNSVFSDGISLQDGMSGNCRLRG